MTVCRRSIPARSNPKVSISTFSSSTNRGRFSTAWGKNLEFDACEMSSTEVFSRLAAGRNEMVALPVFPSRVFRHKTPKDLEGKRIGVPLYTQNAAIFIRGLLQDEYGVDLSGVHWVQGATNSPHSHGNPSAPPLIKPVSIE